jgi:hypothetical protein
LLRGHPASNGSSREQRSPAKPSETAAAEPRKRRRDRVITLRGWSLRYDADSKV